MTPPTVTSQPQGEPAAPVVPDETHRAAADRAIRLAHDHGPVEAAAFFADLPVAAQPLVFGLLARSAASRPSLRPPGTPHPWWTAGELREAHRLWALGHRQPWIIQGHRIYSSHARRVRRAELRVAGS